MKNILLISTLLITSCAVTRAPVSTGGSRSDGIVELSVFRGGLEMLTIDYDGAQKNAADSCKRWGYDSAEAFGGYTQDCLSRDSYGGCSSSNLKFKYQCFNKAD